MKFHKLVGLSGVAAHESAAAIRWGKRFEWPMLLVASWIFVQWYLEAAGEMSPRLLRLSDWIVWLFFLLETAVLVSLVRDRKGYLADNWMNVAIILAGFPILWDYTPLVGLLRQLRLLLLLVILVHFIPSVRQVLLRNHLGYTLLIAIVFTVVSGVVISQVDPAIPSIGDGIWFAWVTVTTVGYGDLVPTSTAGRLIGGVLTFLGLVFFSLISANIAAFLVRRDVEKVERKEGTLGHEIKDLQAQLDRIEQSVERLQVRETDGQRVARIRKRP
jgi:voltage-gated potassium channel